MALDLSADSNRGDPLADVLTGGGTFLQTSVPSVLNTNDAGTTH